MLSRRALWTIVVAGIFQLATTGAYACRCAGQQTPRSAYSKAAAVVVAEVLAVEGNFQAEGGAVATLKTSTAWKVGVPGTLQVATRTTCAFDFHRGETYLVYLTRSAGRAAYSTTICAGNLRAGDARAALDWLGRNGKSMPVGQ